MASIYRQWNRRDLLAAAQQWEPYLVQQHGLKFGKLLGCGWYGCAYATTKPGVVVKVTVDMSEVISANLAAALPKSDPRRRLIPEILEVYVQDLGKDDQLAVIVREDVEDLTSAEKDWWGACGHAMVGPAKLSAIVARKCSPRPKKVPAPTARMQAFVETVDEVVELRRAREAEAWKLDDLHRKNLGVTHAGRVVIRDAGQSYFGSAPPFLSGLQGMWDWASTRRGWLLAGAAFLGAFLLVRRSTMGTIPNQPRRVAALGDSITADGGYLDELLKNLPAGSATRKWGYSSQGVDVIRAHVAEVLAWQPTDVIVLAGVNNLPAGQRAPLVGNITRGLQEIYDQLKAGGVRVVAVQVLPWGGYPTHNRYGQERLDNLNAWIRVASGPDVVVDASSSLSDGTKLRPELTRDGLHPNGQGHVALGRAIADQAFRVAG